LRNRLEYKINYQLHEQLWNHLENQLYQMEDELWECLCDITTE